VKSGELVLDGKTLGDIYLGKIKKWDDEAITKLNPGLKLPSQNIAVASLTVPVLPSFSPATWRK
jgi:phosphate transport system substrate-binding protein